MELVGETIEKTVSKKSSKNLIQTACCAQPEIEAVFLTKILIFKIAMMNKIFDTYRPDGFGTVNGYLFVENHKRAVKNGAKVEFEPADMDYMDRQSGIIDPSGNYWWISKRLEKNDY